MSNNRLITELGLPSSLPRLLILGVGLLLAVLPSWSAGNQEGEQAPRYAYRAMDTDSDFDSDSDLDAQVEERRVRFAAESEARKMRREAILGQFRRASAILGPNSTLDEKAEAAQRLVGIIEGEKTVIPALQAFLKAVREKSAADGSISLQLPEGELTIATLYKALQ